MKERIEECLKCLYRNELDSILLSSPANIKYLTGFRKAEGYLLLSPQKNVYFTSAIYAQEAKSVADWQLKVYETNVFETVAKIAKKMGVKKLGYEAKHLSFLEYKKFKEYLNSKNINFIKTIDLVENMRMTKSRGELKHIKKAIKITLEGFEFVKEIVEQGFSEKLLALEVEKFLKLKGDIKLAFPPIVAFGMNTSRPHHIPSRYKLNNCEAILLDCGAKFEGYCADLTRMYFLNKMPLYLRKIYDIVRGAQEISIKKIKAGIKAKEVDKAAREFICKKNFGKYFSHGLGHGVGLEVHEKPFLNPYSEDILKENMIVTIEPAIYLPNKYGVRLESMVLVKSKRAEVLDGYLYS